MQQGDDNKTRAPLSPAFLSPRPQCGRWRKLGQEGRRVAWGLRALREEGVQGHWPWGVSWPSPHMKPGSSNSHSGVWVQGSVSCVWRYQVNTGLTSQRVRVTPVTEAEESRLEASPLLPLGKEWPFRAAFRHTDSILLQWSGKRHSCTSSEPNKVQTIKK